MHDLAQLAIIWGGVLLATWFAERTRLTAVLFFLAFGSVMVNVGVLPQETTPFVEGFSKLGIILIMFALGFEENPTKFVEGIKRAWGIALFGAIGPFLIAYYVAFEFWGDVKLAMMSGLAMTATAVSLTMVSLRSEGLHRTDAARGIMTSAVLDDIASLALVAILVPLATGQSGVSMLQIFAVVTKALLFFGIVIILGRWVFPQKSSINLAPLRRLFRRCGIRLRFLETRGRGIAFLERYGVRDILMLGQSEQATLTILLLTLTISLTAHYLGFHPAVGAYMAGLILKQEYFHIDEEQQKSSYENCKYVIDNVAFSWIGPVFFINLGTKLVLDFDIIISILPETLAMTVGLFVIQILSAMLAARLTASFEWHESILIGLGMLGRAELAFIVLDIGYVQNAIFTKQAFFTLMFTAFCLNISVPLTIRLWRPYFKGEKQLNLRLGKRTIALSKPSSKRPPDFQNRHP